MRILLLSMLALAAVACQNSPAKEAEAPVTGTAPATAAETVNQVDSTQFTTIEWIDQNKDYGKVTEGQQVEVAFRFKNSGTKPLVIYSVAPACGCTAAEPPKEPILPGNEGVIKGSFDSKGRVGTNNKSIHVRANTSGSMDHHLQFKVEVAAASK
ncbi:DUF1573 domain-containing protein [Flavihumibacter sp. CACIAM 22H1]|uniref:DUF1573 domain-containing protein n=1 Tax=Flavihumibacter sp. CACIAM 22H1 TaxID=1812911 RepID=UPI0007A810B4|nr:DUF1573 domain-containing protein [Flavihumibacter sp. CACIAM 22H1]KYP14906.1 MAG: hypothetical protein A1D16_03280 [Flavihumibacter sp. CACIAM 22H1]